MNSDQNDVLNTGQPQHSSPESKGTGSGNNPRVRRGLVGDVIKILTTLDNAAIDLKERADAFIGFGNEKSDS